MSFWRNHQRSSLVRDVFTRPLEQLSACGLALLDQARDLVVLELEDLVEQEHRALGGRQPLQEHDDARERLRLARVVLAAGFPADAARAAYEALARAIRGLLEESPPPGHPALVAAVYRDRLPAGRLPVGAHAALAMLNDVASLEAQGVPVAAELATRTVEEAERWVIRLSRSSPPGERDSRLPNLDCPGRVRIV